MTGEYVAFLDPDDAFHPEMIECLLDTSIRREADMVTCGYDTFETEGPMKNARSMGRTAPCGQAVLTAEEIFDAISDGQYAICVWNKIYKRRIWEHLRFPEGRIYEDVLVAPCVVAQCERIAVVPRALVFHRKRAGASLRRSRSKTSMSGFIPIPRFGDCLESRMPGKSGGFREETTRTLVFEWAELKKLKAPADITDALKNEILKKAGTGIRHRKLKSRVTWWLFRLCPGMLLPARACFRKLKSRLGKESRVVA